jgi:hypothetical protein
VEALALAVAWPPDLVPREAPAEAHCHAMARSPINPISAARPLWRKKAR